MLTTDINSNTMNIKKIKSCLVALLAIVSIPLIEAQTTPDGFASVSAKGVETTTGGSGGKTVIAETLTHLQYYIKTYKAYTIIVKGTIESEDWIGIEVGNNTTVIGYGKDATLKNIGLIIPDGSENIIIRNLNIQDSYVEGDWEGKENDNDGIRIDNSHHIWVDHCFLSHCGDGLIDSRKNSDYITISYTQFNNHNKAFGVGWTDSTNFHMTIHHCWMDSTNQRNPSFDQGIGHLYNNYLSNIGYYGNLSRGAARVIVQNSVFYKASNPLKISDEATLYAENNKFTSCSGSNSGNVTIMPYDPADYYSYTLDPVADVKDIVVEESGPQEWVTALYTTYTPTKNVAALDNSIDYYVDSTSGNLYLNSDQEQKVNVAIYAMSGQLVKQQAVYVAGPTNVALGNTAPGIYLVRFEMDNKIETGKFSIR